MEIERNGAESAPNVSNLRAAAILKIAREQLKKPQEKTLKLLDSAIEKLGGNNNE